MTIKLYQDFMSASVYKDSTLGDCTNGGASSKHDNLYVVAKHVTLKDVEEFCKENPAYTVEEFFKLDYDFYNNSHYGHYCRLEPINKGNKWYMFGGNYLATSDSRFKDFVGGCKYPVPIHDRTEGNNIQD